MKKILEIHDKIRPLFHKGGKFEKFWPLFDAQDTFMFTPAEVTKEGAHVRDAIDLKRVMITVVFALIPCTLFGMWNAGHQHNVSNSGASAGFAADILRGAWIVLPIIFTSYAAGGLWEVLFACTRKHEINEGFLVTGLLFPLTLPPTVPLWQVAVGISFGVVIGKEVFGGTGMNVLNPALTARAFLYFAYPAQLSGEVWTSLVRGGETVNGFSGATALSIVATVTEAGASPVAALQKSGFDWLSLANGVIPGSIGETCFWACLLGAAVLIATGIGSWQIMLSGVLGLICCAGLFNMFGNAPFTQLPASYHMVLGSFAFGIVFMATDPVSAAATTVGKWIYGFLVGFITVIVRVANPAYPEGVMLAILFMNVSAPLIDNYVVEAHIRRRAA